MKTQKGITLIALIITIIVMLILVGVSVSVALNTGLFKTAQGVAKNTQTAANEETKLSEGKVTVGGLTYDSLEDYVQLNKPQTVKKIEGPEVGEIVLYDEDGDGDTERYVVLYNDDTYGCQIMACEVKNININIEATTDIKTIKNIYNNTIKMLYEEAYKYLNSDYAAYARVLGSDPKYGTITIGQIVEEDEKCNYYDFSDFYNTTVGAKYKPGSGTEFDGLLEGWKNRENNNSQMDVNVMNALWRKFDPANWPSHEAVNTTGLVDESQRRINRLFAKCYEPC